MNQRRATAQLILNQELPDDVQTELRLDTTNGADSSAISVAMIPPSASTFTRPRTTARKLTFKALGNRKGPKTGRK